MAFDGQDELVLKCSDILETLESDFTQFSKNLAGSVETYIDRTLLTDVMSLVFENLVKKTYDKDAISQALSDCFGNDKNLIKFMLSASLLHLLHKFNTSLKDTNPKLLHCGAYLGNAIDTFMSEFGYFPKQAQSASVKTGLNFGSSGGFSFFGSLSDELANAKTMNSQLEFLNLYKGVNVKSKAQVISCDENSALFKVEFLQILAMKSEGNAYILKGENLTSNVKADIMAINLNNNTVQLNNFTRVKEMYANLRKYPRVHPNRFTPVVLSDALGKQINGNLFDISQGGIGVVSAQNAGFANGSEINAKFSLNMNGEQIDVNLDVKLVIALNYQGSMRYCCQIIKPQAITDKIIEFSKLRETETIKELEAQAALYR